MTPTVYNENSDKYKRIVSQIEDIISSSNSSAGRKYIELRYLMERVCRDLTRDEPLQFPSLFSRIVFVSQKYNLPKGVEWHLQNIRVKSSFLLKNGQNLISQRQFEDAVKCVNAFISIVYVGWIGEGRSGDDYEDNKDDDTRFYDKLRVQVTCIDTVNEKVTAYADSVNREIIFRYNVKNVNDKFNPAMNKIWIGAQLNLLNCSVDERDNTFIPQYIVLEPDYLIDASALAECFQNYGKSHLHYFRRKFEPNANSQHILLGNLANYFLDELVYTASTEDLEFQDVFLKAFRLFPFEFTSCEDIKSKDAFLAFMVKAKTQFENIKRVVSNDFRFHNIDPQFSTLEPSFFCERFGFQGRLDLFQKPENNEEKSKIVELKSGGLPFPKNNPSKISINHEAQTTVYRLIIQSVFNILPRDIQPFILYSASENEGENMRYSAAYQNLEKEIVNTRNLIVATEHDLYTGNEGVIGNILREMLDVDSYGLVPRFFTDRLEAFDNILKGLTGLERKYLYRFIGFITRELYIQKAGDTGNGANIGVSLLWNTEFEERKNSFELVSDLKIGSIGESETGMEILFITEDGCEFVNFRVGDICVLYPHENESDTILSNQILKGTVAEISSKNILVRFRYRQKNKNYLYKYKSWVIEHDSLDHAYNSMFKSLFSFIRAPLKKRALLLGVGNPESGYAEQDSAVNSPEEKQRIVLGKAIAAKDYFLIVGPPGTGKTSIFARNLINYYYTGSSLNILVLAYTNRAVDELCESILCAFGSKPVGCDNYIRIGSDLSCAAPYKHRLLQNIAKNVKSRDELRQIILNSRIFVGTLASINGKPELFGLKKFDIAIIDEASQILEPQIIGLLTQFDKFIMIGDHKQLSTITLQDEYKSKVVDAELNEIELEDCRESYFERLYRICRKNNRTNMYDTLIYQGRMHTEIAQITNRYFYDNELSVAAEWQKEPLNLLIEDGSDFLQKIIVQKRVAFFPVINNSPGHNNDKVNEPEADMVVNICKSILSIYKYNKLPFEEGKTLGIITPYRNQIALIRHRLNETGIPELKNVMIDTVERFQGSQRDIIIVSFCVNKSYQLDFLNNLNREKTVDRKLNVTLTRARQQLFLIGNDYILKQNNIYSKMLGELEHIAL